MNSQVTNLQKPTLVNVIAWMTLASGVVNLFWGLGLGLTGLLSVIGIFCVPFLLLPTVLGIFEIIYAAKLLSSQPQPTQPSTTIAVLEIVCIVLGNVFSVVVGILALVFYNDVSVRDYFAQLNGTVVPVTPVAAVVPAASVYTTVAEPVVPAPIVEEEILRTEESPLPDDEETPKG